MSLAHVRNQRGWAHIDAPTFRVDFNRLGKHGSQVIDAVFHTGVAPLASDLVRLEDAEGNSCLGTVLDKSGGVYRIRVELSTWRDGSPSAQPVVSEEK